MTFTKHTVPLNSIEAEALRCERDAVASAFKEMVAEAVRRKGWNEGVAIRVTERLILAYEIGVALRESRVHSRLVGDKLTAPPEALKRPWREVRALTRDERAVILVEKAFMAGWKRNRRRGRDGAPKKTAGATVMELMKRRNRTENDKRERYRMRKRLAAMIQELRSRSP